MAPERAWRGDPLPRVGRARHGVRGPAARGRRPGVEILRRGRQRGRRGDRGERLPRPDGADRERPRRRPLRHRLGPEARRSSSASTPPAARRWRSRPRRSRPSRTARSRSSRPTPGPCPAARTAGSSCTRSTASCRWRGARAGDPLRRGGLPALARHRLRLGALGAAASRTSRASPRSSCPAAARRAEGERFRNPALAKTLRAPRRRRGATPTTAGPIADAHRALLAGERRLLRAGGLRPPPLDLGRARSRRTTAATTSGSCRRTARGSRRSSCSTCSRASTSRRWGAAAPTSGT